MAALQLPVGLPRTVVLKNKYNGKYMQYKNEAGEQQGLLQFTGEEAVSPYAKFYVESSKSSNDLVHIRCASNNKYWRRLSETQFWIGALADGPEEDASKWSCTLFKPVPVVDGQEGVRFLHVQLNHYACLFSSAAPFNDNFLYAGWEEPNSDLMDVCEVVDRDSLPVLPQRAAFKGGDGLYLVGMGGGPLVFAGKDNGATAVGNEVFYTSAGAIRIKNNSTGTFWGWSTLFGNTICTVSTDTSESDPSTVFWPVKVGGNIIALRSQANNLFCREEGSGSENPVLIADSHTITQEARLQVEELVISREIYDVEFRVLDGRIYDEQIILTARSDTSNNSPNPVTNTLSLEHTDTKSSTWEGNVSLTVGVSTTIKTGVPFIAEGEIDISVEATGSYTWGETKETSDKLTDTYDAQVSPYSKMYVSLLATQGTCDVPFSYTQRDLLYDGTYVTTHKDDGLYTGINSYSFHVETREEPLPDSLTLPPSASSD